MKRNYIRYLLILISLLVVCLIVVIISRINSSKKTIYQDTHQPAGTGMVIEERTEIQGPFATAEAGHNAPQVQTIKTYIQGRRMRSDSGDYSVIFDFGNRMFYTLNPKTRTYTEMTLEQFREAQKQAMQWVNQMNAQMEQSLKDMPEETRKDVMEKLGSLHDLGEQKKGHQITVKKTGNTQTINGYTCEEYEVFEGGQKSAVAWLTTSISTKEYDSYQKEMKQWTTDLSPSASDTIEEWDYLHEKGFPVKIIHVDPAFGNISMNREVTRVVMQSLSDTLFQPPKEYTLQNIPYPGTMTPESGVAPQPETPPYGMPAHNPAVTEKDSTK